MGEAWEPIGPPIPASQDTHAAAFARRVLVLIVGAAALGIWLLLGLVQLYRTYTALERGRDSIEEARLLLIEGSGDPASEEQLPIAELRAARDSFRLGHDRVEHLAVLPLRLLPIVGRQVNAVSAMSEAGATVAGAGATALEDVDELLELEHGPGPGRVEILRRFGAIAETAARGMSGLDLGPERALVKPLREARDELAGRITELRTALADGTAGARGAADLFAGPRRYLLVAANNAEMRAGSGMWLSLGILATHDGVLDLQEMRSVIEVPVPPDVPIGGDLEARWSWLSPNREWRNLMLSPRFDASAELAMRMWKAATGEDLDGVIAVDPIALREILRATGPVTASGREISAGNLTKELFLRQYLRHPATSEIDERREELGAIADAAMEALDNRPWSITRLARGLAKAAQGRHLLAWSPHEREMDAWRAAEIDGSLPPDALALSLLSRGGTKLDQFIDVIAQVTSRPTPAGSDVSVRVSLRNSVPTGLPRYVAGPHRLSGVGEGVYLGILTLNVPGNATWRPLRGGIELSTGGRDGPTSMTGTVVRLPRDGRAVVTFSFSLPRGARTLEIQPSARVPGVRWRTRQGELDDDAAHRIWW